MPVVCTIITPSTSAQAQLLADSLRRHHPDARLLAAAPETVPADRLAGFDEVDPNLGDSTPVVLTRALRDAEVAIFLAPTVYVYAPLSTILVALSESSVVLVPRAATIPDDGERPDAVDLALAGRISTAIVGVRASDEGHKLLRWWGGAHDAAAQRSDEPVDGRLLAACSKQFAGVNELSDPGTGVSSWNLHERALALNGETMRVDDGPLRAFDFDGFRPDRPFWLCDRATRVRVVGDRARSTLCGEYARRLRDAEWTPPRANVGLLDRLGNGQRVDVYVAQLWRTAASEGRDFGDPLHAGSADAFAAWAREAAHLGTRHGVNRYLLTVYLMRPDLQQAFPDLDGGDGERLVRWGFERAGVELSADLVPTPLDERRAPASERISTRVIGFLNETFGLAEAGRLYVRSLEAAGVPVSTLSLIPQLPTDSASGTGPAATQPASEGALSPATEPAAFNLACLNGDHLAQQIRRDGVGLLRGRPTIGQWGWETDVLPPSWLDAIPHLDEVWVYSRFMSQNLGRLLPIPVVVVPPAIVLPEPGRPPFDFLQDDHYTIVSMVDLFSTIERKNPGGLVDAFVSAFDEDEGPRLVIKTINATHRPQAVEELRARAGGRADIVFVDALLDDAEKSSLLARADCYVSLHRSEGFGLPLAESMALGTPVIATGYSGNTDFMTPANSLLVDWRETRVGSGSRIYPAHGRWAEPDIDHAAHLLREVWSDPTASAAWAARARADIDQLYAPARAGAIARSRLEHLADRGRAGTTAPAPGTPAQLARVEQALAADPSPAGGALSNMTRRAVSRLIRPFTHHERDIDRALLEALQALTHELEGGQRRR